MQSSTWMQNRADRVVRPYNGSCNDLNPFRRRCWNLGLKTLWQRSFYDHVIRNKEDYLHIWKYIDDNPAKWAEDEYYYAE